MSVVAGHVDDGSRVPYRRWRRWVASLRRRAVVVRAAENGGDPHDRVYLGYGVVLLALVYGPILWSALVQAAAALSWPAGASGTLAAAAGCVLGLGVLCTAGLASARAGGPLWTTPAEATFALGGQFAPHDVLRRRAAWLVAGAAAVGAFLGSAVAQGAVASGTVLAGAVAALLAQVPLAVGVAAQVPGRVRSAATTTTAALLVLGAGGAGAAGASASAVLPGASGAVAVVVAGLLGVGGAVLVLRVLPDGIDMDRAAAGQARTVTAARGLVGGESGAVGDVLGPRAYAGRAATLPRWLLARAPLVARDLLGLRRRPAAFAVSLVAGCAGALLVQLGADGGPALVTVVGAAALYAASRTWADGLHAYAAQPRPGALLPGSTTAAVAGHAAVPGALGLLAAVLGTAVGALAGGAGAAGTGAVVVLAVVVAALGVRIWVAGATAAPPGLFTPMMTPNGDMSMLVLGAWYLRGWLVVAAAGWLLHRAGAAGSPGPASVAVVALAAGLVAAAVRRFARA
ncbi:MULTISPECIES: hypothetical protein [unclassified Isoptericola]|uniref:hypothetical protein n=1 Tax=unclassified Isoptericola TaxID=2623355 RepID=UPI003668E5C1